MRWKKRAIAVVVCGVAILIVNICTPPFIQRLASINFQNTRDANLVEYHMLAMLANAVLLVTIYPAGYRGGAPLAEGLRFGILMALIVSLPNALHQYALIDAPAANMFIPVGWSILKYGIAGIVVALVYGREAYPAPAPA